jgi:membrane-associated phospholipid phosphatase
VKIAPAQQLSPRTLRPIDKLFVANSVVMICLLGVAARNDARAFLLIAGHIVAIGILFVLSRYSSAFAAFLHDWFLLAYLPFCYKSVPYLVEALRLHLADLTLANWDRMMWKTDPVFWLSSFQNGMVVETLQVVYTMFLPGVLALGIVLWLRQSRQEFRYGAFGIAVTFVISYLGYLALPARGPRFMPYAAQHPSLHGLWTFTFLQRLLNTLEGTQYDCFPSGHVAVVLVGCYVARKISPVVFYVFLAFSTLITFSTVYLRYHYVIDVIAGAALAILVVAAGPGIYRQLDSANTA